MAELAQSSRKLSKDLQQTEEAARKQLEARQVAAMREKADDMRSGAIASAVCLGVAGGLHVAAFGCAVSDAKGVQAPAPQLCSGAGGVAEKSADVVKAAYDAEAQRSEADAREAESAAKSAEAKADQLKDDAQQAGEIAKKAFEAIRSVFESRNAAQMAIVSMRG